MKRDEKQEARRLRQEEGLAITEICKRLGVAKSSVSLWVRDIELTQAQQDELHQRHYAYRSQVEGGATNARKFRELREQYQQEGRLKAREHDSLHIAGCMLYWGEGTKGGSNHRSHLALANSDAGMMQFYIKFLRDSLGVEEQKFRVRIACYLGNNLSIEEIEQYWLNLLELPRECLRKPLILQPKSSQQKGRKLLYGVCHLTVLDVRLVQHILGAIQEYTGIDKPEWLL